MKKVLLSLLMQVPVLVFAQFSLKGEFTTAIQNKKLYFIYIQNNAEVIDSVVINNGKFSFSLDLKEPSVAVLLLQHQGNALKDQGPKDVYRLFIEPGNATLVAKDSIAQAQLNGLAIFKQDMAYKTALKTSESKLIALNKEFATLTPEKQAKAEIIENFQERYEGLLDERKAQVIGFIKDNPQSYISLFAFNQDLGVDNMDYTQAEALFNGLDDKLKNYAIANIIKQKLDIAKVTGIGAIATDFEEKTPEGIPLKLSSYKGQYVLLDFWASWCGPCRKENPFVVSAYEKYKDKGFTILGVSIDTDRNAWQKAIKTDNLMWAQLIDSTTEISKTYGIDAIPKNFLIDPHGKIIAKNLRGTALEDKLKEIFEKK
ncbi:TlpA disulfide reductase family protein [Pedobacter glucosidilyticus]|uniref:TlpA disulfide reductase family protein n=1 Tax=Pedobacter glucosidilyticus TaxID=1122941 RepID=UPI0026EE459E|nr:TlpA disulfide reductase family protein [Pedobacter glucosidilyticus]